MCDHYFGGYVHTHVVLYIYISMSYSTYYLFIYDILLYIWPGILEYEDSKTHNMDDVIWGFLF